MKNLRIFNIIFLILMLNLKIYSQFNVNMSNQENIETSGPKVTDEVKPLEKTGEVLYSSVAEIDAVLQEKINNVNQLLKEADDLYQQGEYDKSYEKSESAKSLISEIENLKLQKNCLLKLEDAKKAIKEAEDVEAQKYAPDLLANAKSSLLLAQNSYESKNFDDTIKNGDDAINYAKAAIEKVNEIKKQEEEAKLAKQTELPKPEEKPATEEKKVVKGKYVIWKTYKVRLIPERRDCLWRIAEYDFIYNNPWKWPIIYKANKHQIKDPDLIYPGQVFDIPKLDEKGNPILVEEGSELKETSGQTSETNKAETHGQPSVEK